jgi:hypothetical protein
MYNVLIKQYKAIESSFNWKLCSKNIRFLPSTVTEKNATKNILEFLISTIFSILYTLLLQKLPGHFILSLTFPRPYIFWNVHDSSTFYENIRGILTSCSEMPGYWKHYCLRNRNKANKGLEKQVVLLFRCQTNKWPIRA